MTADIPGSAVADVGAGTGKLTRVLVAAGLDVTAVEPDPGMRAQHSGAPVVDGRGELLPFADGSLDSVVYGQSWHWVSKPLALAEAARVLRSGGTLAQVWNAMDGSVPWVAELDELTGGRPGVHDGPVIGASDGFAAAELETFTWVRELPVGDLAALARTWSWVGTQAPGPRDAILERVQALARRVAVDGVVSLPHGTRCVRSRRL